MADYGSPVNGPLTGKGLAGRNNPGGSKLSATSENRTVGQGVIDVPETPPMLQMKGIYKRFSGIEVLTDVSFELQSGEVHCLLGENGAGKSTLMKILSGVYRQDEGDIFIDGTPVEIQSPAQAQRLGIATIYQEFNLVPGMSVAENIFLGREFTRFGKSLIDRTALYQEARKALERLGVRIDPGTTVASLSVGQRQLIEIAKSLSIRGRILIMDEPTAALSHQEAEELFRIIRLLREQGVGIIYISHRLEEVTLIGDRATVLRDGRVIETLESLEGVPTSDLIRLMVGREIRPRRAVSHVKDEAPILSVDGLTRHGVYHDVTFYVRRGEILGLAGLVGSGRTEVMRGIFGADPVDGGRVTLSGQRVEIRSPRDAVRLGIGFLTEDRKEQGLVLGLSAARNITLTNLRRFVSWGRVNRDVEWDAVKALFERLDIRPRAPSREARYFSGGNQQKTVLAKWLLCNNRVLIFDEPTRGIDVGAKAEIYDLIVELASQGVAIIVVSSDLPEILALCDRILVMREGRIVGELTHDEASEERILALAMGESHGA